MLIGVAIVLMFGGSSIAAAVTRRGRNKKSSPPAPAPALPPQGKFGGIRDRIKISE